jgi:hypothetical protein
MNASFQLEFRARGPIALGRRMIIAQIQGARIDPASCPPRNLRKPLTDLLEPPSPNSNLYRDLGLLLTVVRILRIMPSI